MPRRDPELGIAGFIGAFRLRLDGRRGDAWVVRRLCGALRSGIGFRLWSGRRRLLGGTRYCGLGRRAACRIVAIGAVRPVHRSRDRAPWWTRTSSPSTVLTPLLVAALARVVALSV